MIFYIQGLILEIFHEEIYMGWEYGMDIQIFSV